MSHDLSPSFTPGRLGGLAAVCLTLWLSACAATPPPSIPVLAPSEAAAASLAGHWWGTYGSVESGRHGRVRFTLVADGELEASGDVLMVPRRPVEADIGSERHTGSAEQHHPPIPLAVRFVQLDDAGVIGALEPYEDPDCGCLVSTTFVGWLDGDTISGTYVSQGGPMHLGHSGRWSVERRHSADESDDSD